MSKITRNLLFTLLLLALLPAVHAFESTLLIEGGVGIPLDDIEGTNEMKGAWALAWDGWMIKDWLGIGVSPWFANVEMQGDDPLESYFSSLEGINLYLKLRPTKVGALNFPEQALVKRISPFVALGGGWSTHGSLDENGVADNPSIQPGFRGHLTLPHAAAGISFLSKWNTTLDLGVKYDLFTKDNIDLTEVSGSMNDALLTPYVGLGIHFGTPIAKPLLIQLGSLTGFSTLLGTPSVPQSYQLQGKDLSGNIQIVAPEGFELSSDGGQAWAKSLTVPAGFAGDIWVRLTGAKAGSFDGSIGHQSEGAAGLSLPVNGVVREPILPALVLAAGGVGPFSTELGVPSDPQSYKIQGSNLTGDITITAPEGYEFSLDGGTSWNTSMIVPAGFNKDIWVRLTGAEAGNFSGSISHSSPGVPDLALPVVGMVREPMTPSISLAGGALGAFSTELGVPSDPQSYKIKGENLTGDITITAPEGYEFSLDGGTSWNTSMIVPAGFNKDIWVRLTGAEAGNFGGNIAHASPGAMTFELPVMGTVIEPVIPEIPAPPAVPELKLEAGGLGAFSTVVGTPSAPQSYKLTGTNLTGDILVVAPAGFEMSADGGSSWVTSANLPQDFDGTIWLRLTGADAGNFTGNVAHSSDGAMAYDLPVVGLVTEPQVSELDELLDLLKHIVHFDTNLYTIRADDRPFLDRVAESLKKLPDVMIEIQGHTDSTGNDKINEPLSYNRAKVVKDYLVARGVDAEQIESKGYGSKQPIASNDTRDGRQENRRAQMVLIR